MLNTPPNIDWQRYQHVLEQCAGFSLEGRIVEVVGLIVEGHGLGMSVGSLCSIENEMREQIMAEVVGFK